MFIFQTSIGSSLESADTIGHAKSNDSYSYPHDDYDAIAIAPGLKNTDQLVVSLDVLDTSSDNSMHFNQQQSNPPNSPQQTIAQLLLREFITIVNDNLTSLTNTQSDSNYTTFPTTTTTGEDPITDEPFTFHDETKPYISAEKWYDKYLWWRIILVSYILVLGIVGNSAIIYSICKVPRFRPQPTNIFILNMAIGDLIASIFCPIVALIRVVNEFYVMGPFICRIEGFVKVTCLFVSSYSLIVLSFQWLLCVVKPFWRRMTIVHSWVALGVIWTLSLAMGTPLLFTRELRSRKWANLVERWCQEDTKFITYYWITVCFSLIYVPIICMTVALVVILIKMDKFGYKLRRSSPRSTFATATTSNSMYQSTSKSMSLEEVHSNTMELQSAVPISSTTNGRYEHSNGGNSNNGLGSHIGGQSANLKQLAAKDARMLNVNMKYRRHIVSILLMYLIVSAVCWLPLNLSIIYRLTTIGKTFFPNSFNEFNFFCELGVATSSALNPIIFGFLSRPFRQIIKRSWTNVLNLLCNIFGTRGLANSNYHSNSNRSRRAQNNNNNNHNQQMLRMKTMQRTAAHRAVENSLGQTRSSQRGNEDHKCIIAGSSPINTARSTTALVSKLLSNQTSKSRKNRSNKRVTFEPTVTATVPTTTTPNLKNSISETNTSFSQHGSLPLKSSLKTSHRLRNICGTNIGPSTPTGDSINSSHRVVAANVNMNPAGHDVSEKDEFNHDNDTKVKPLQHNRQSSVESMASINIEVPTPTDQSDGMGAS